MIELFIFVLVAAVAGSFFWVRLGTIFNPASLSSFSLAAASAIALLFDAQVRAGQDLHAGFGSDPSAVAIIYGVGLVAFLLPWITAKRLEQPAVLADSAPARTIVQIALVVTVVLLITWFSLGQLPIVEMLMGNASINDHLSNLKGLLPGLMMLNLTMATVLALYFSSAVAPPPKPAGRKLLLVVAGLVLLMAALWQGNRQLILIILFFVVARQFLQSSLTIGSDFRRSLKLRMYTFAAIVAFLLAFSAINYIRLAAEGQFSGPLEILLYYSWPVYNIASISDHVGLIGTGDIGYLFTEILPARWGGKDIWAEIAPLLFEPTSPSGYFSYWLLSFGIAGVAAGSLLFSLATRYIYARSVRSEHHFRIYVLVLWNCAVIAVYSHFLSLAYFWAPLLGLIAVNFASRLRLVSETAEQRSHYAPAE